MTLTQTPEPPNPSTIPVRVAERKKREYGMEIRKVRLNANE